MFNYLLRLVAFVSCTVCVMSLRAQDDSIKVRELEEVVITATRNERTMGALPMPVTLVQTPMIKTMGSVRLNDVLTEQTGLVVVPQVNGQGNGIQVQGFNPDYTLILLDGEPIVGRYTGSLELSRLTVGNIKQVEIVKGPSSSLYGSEALAGVINIITERPTANTVRLSSRYATNNTFDMNANAGLVGRKWTASIFANRYSTDGYDLSPQNYGKTVSPFRNYTITNKLTYKFNKDTEITVSGRWFNENQDFAFDVPSNNTFVRTYGVGRSSDWNLNPVLHQRFSQKVKGTLRYYQTNFSTDTQLKRQSDDSVTYTDYFKQKFARVEANLEYFPTLNHSLLLGAGQIDESVETSRYGDATQRLQQTRYAFVQHEWTPILNLSVVSGVRYDNNRVYGDQLSPKLSLRYDWSDNFALKVSGGFGFKSPDFRQLYFNFTNSAAGGYTVLGTEVVLSQIEDLSRNGQISAIIEDPSVIGKLNAERSISINGGFILKPLLGFSMDCNLFYNSIDNLIDTQVVAITTSNQSIYSYKNIQRAYTTGLEANVSYQLLKNLTISTGYQLLYAKDKDVEENIRNGGSYSFYRDPNTLVQGRLTTSDYFGLYNRSRHQGNIKIFYRDERSGWEGSIRVLYRGKFGIGGIRGNIQGEVVPSSDRDNNGILDTYDFFVSGYALTNLSIAKSIKSLRLQLGVDNLFDYTEPIYIPNIPGRLIYGSVQYTLKL
ncbi:MAG: TonB-dependent receptor [Bacteroidetes bacterium]|nr:TonB-dependent receptor [Bacteroidota bacterium]